MTNSLALNSFFATRRRCDFKPQQKLRYQRLPVASITANPVLDLTSTYQDDSRPRCDRRDHGNRRATSSLIR